MNELVLEVQNLVKEFNTPGVLKLWLMLRFRQKKGNLSRLQASRVVEKVLYSI